MSRAFQLEPTSLDVTKAARFGEVVRLFNHPRQHPSPLKSVFAAEVVRRLLDEHFDPSRDYVIVTGAITPMVAMVAAVVAQFGEVRALCFDVSESVRDYVVVTMGERHYATV